LEYPVGQAAQDERHLSYLPHVDGLRAIAVLSVIAFHAAPSQVPGGFVGVDIFFVISGFLITSLLHKEIARNAFSLPNFLARRARRIVPALAVVMLATFVAAYFLLSPEQMREFGRSITSASLFGANIHFYRTTDYFALSAQEQPLLHTWSLAIEEQFYLIWPLTLLLLLTRVPRRAAFIILAVAVAASLGGFLVYSWTEPTYAFFMPHTRAWGLLLGALLALSVDGLNFSPRTSEVLAVLGLAGIGASIFLFSETWPYPGVATTLATLGAASIIAASRSNQPWTARLLASTPFVFIGLISYSLYLWHWPIFSFARLQAASPSVTMIALMVAASFVLAWLSWRFVETPLRGRYGQAMFATRKALISAVCLLVAIAAIGVSIKAGDGWAWRLDGISRSVYDQIASTNPRRGKCDGVEGIFREDPFCAFGRGKSAGQSYDVAIFGDSNADHFVPMLSRLGEAKGFSGRQVTQSTCAPLLGVWRINSEAWREKKCREYQEGVIAFLDANPGLKLAILSANWSGYRAGLGHNGLDLASGKADGAPDASPRTFEALLQTTVEYLTKRGVKVLILGQVPHLKQSGEWPVDCAIDAKRKGASAETRACGIPAKPVLDTLGPSNAAISAVAARVPGATAVLGSNLLCDATQCYTVMDGVFLYRNPGHLNRVGSELLANYIALPDLSVSAASRRP
jgi:peptidoglycan/LPS O-acetylase OafA/YrhL